MCDVQKFQGNQDAGRRVSDAALMGTLVDALRAARECADTTTLTHVSHARFATRLNTTTHAHDDDDGDNERSCQLGLCLSADPFI